MWFSDRDYIDIIQIYDLPAVLPDEIYIRINVRLCRVNIQFAIFVDASLSKSLVKTFFASWLIVAYRLRSGRSNKLMAGKHIFDYIGHRRM